MEKEKQMETEDLTGRKFGRLTVIERSKDHIGKRGKHLPMWLCKCECGTKKIVYLKSSRIPHLYRWWNECYLFTINASFLVKI